MYKETIFTSAILHDCSTLDKLAVLNGSVCIRRIAVYLAAATCTKMSEFR